MTLAELTERARAGDLPPVLIAGEVAPLWRMSPWQVYQLEKRGELPVPALHLGRKLVWSTVAVLASIGIQLDPQAPHGSDDHGAPEPQRPATVDTRTAAAWLDVGYETLLDAARAGDAPVKPIRVGRALRWPTALLLEVLGLRNPRPPLQAATEAMPEPSSE